MLSLESYPNDYDPLTDVEIVLQIIKDERKGISKFVEEKIFKDCDINLIKSKYWIDFFLNFNFKKFMSNDKWFRPNYNLYDKQDDYYYQDLFKPFSLVTVIEFTYFFPMTLQFRSFKEFKDIGRFMMSDIPNVNENQWTILLKVPPKKPSYDCLNFMIEKQQKVFTFYHEDPTKVFFAVCRLQFEGRTRRGKDNYIILASVEEMLYFSQNFSYRYSSDICPLEIWYHVLFLKSYDCFR